MAGDKEVCRASEIPFVITVGSQKGPYCVASKDRKVVYYIGTQEGCYDYLRRLAN